MVAKIRAALLFFGAVRADFHFFGFGDAGNQAGRMKQQGRMWVLPSRL
jgi:membrane-bound lytic murein transglycosylase